MPRRPGEVPHGHRGRRPSGIARCGPAWRASGTARRPDKSPTTGRLYHHLAILARPNYLQQLFNYSKSLSVPQPFLAARESIMTLFEPVLESEQTYYRSSPAETCLASAPTASTLPARARKRFDAAVASFPEQPG